MICQGILIHPSLQLSIIKAIPEICQARVGIGFFVGEAVEVCVGHLAGFGEDVAEGVVEVSGGDGVGGSYEHRDVSTAVAVVVEGLGPCGVCDGEEAADAARALHGGAEVEAAE